MIPLGLYVHLPWCVSRCPYCDFNAHAARAFDESRYAAALCAQLRRSDGAQPLSSVFFGGGTPSRFSPAAIARILDAVRTRYVCTDDLEVSLEANPESADRAKFQAYREAGVTRLSIGVQSFAAAALRALGRAHGPDDAWRAVADARDAGVGRINIDLMYGLPGQTTAAALADLRRALDAGAEHLSWYQLTLEPGTPFARRPPALPDGDAVWEMQRAGEALLRGAGFEQYEVSAWCRDGAVCRHNINYWEYGDYIGIGAGACGKRTGASGAVYRTRQIAEPEAWMAAAERGADGARTSCTPAVRRFEFLLGALRLRTGFAWELFEARTGCAAHALEAGLREARAQDLVEETPGRLRASARGWRYLDDLCALFLPSADGPRARFAPADAARAGARVPAIIPPGGSAAP